MNKSEVVFVVTGLVCTAITGVVARKAYELTKIRKRQHETLQRITLQQDEVDRLDTIIKTQKDKISSLTKELGKYLTTDTEVTLDEKV